MYLDRIATAGPGTHLIVRSGLAAAQWELALADAGLPDGRDVWPSLPLTSFPQWLAARWEEARFEGAIDPDRCLMSPAQTERLWRRVIEDSDEGPGLITSSGLAGFARTARRSLCDFGLAPGHEPESAWQGDGAAFLRWNGRFEAELDRNGWLDPDSLLYRFNRLPLEPARPDLLVLDPTEETPESARLAERWRGAGRRVESVCPDGAEAVQRHLIAADPADELAHAADWAAERIEAAPGSRLAVVVPDLDARRDEVERAFADRLGASRVSGPGGRPLAGIGVFGAALAALRLLAPGAGFGALSRCLRSPFFASADADRARHAAGFEIWLRSDARAHEPFVASYGRYGLRAELLRRLPDTARRLDEVLARLPRRATPTGWAGIWQVCLRTLGWLGESAALGAAERDAWDRAFAGFAALTPVVGSLDLSAALGELERVLGAESIHAPQAASGVHLVSRIGQIGPGFSGAWISRFTDQSWPEPVPHNPLVPWPVQAAHAMPGASPAATLEASRAELARLFRRVPEAVFSCPERIADQPQVPNPWLRGWQRAPAGPSARTSGETRARIGARARETLPDPAPPFAGERIPGGPRTLDRQSACPAVAFCTARLGAEPLEAPARGLDARLRGLLLHRALEIAFDPHGSGDVRRRLEPAVARALAELAPPGGAAWQAQLGAEKARALRLVTGLLELESGRAPFSVAAVERRTEIAIGGRRIRCRIDRIDRLAAGGELVIDYKTGSGAVRGWFDARLGDCQLPLYAQHREGIAGIAAIRLGDDGVECDGAGRLDGALPGRVRVFGADEWNAQLARWREQLERLVDEFVRGDVRVRADGAALADADGAFAALTRTGDLRR